MIKVLKAPKRASKYKSEDAYLNAVYNKNKQFIDEKIKDFKENNENFAKKSTKSIFKSIVKDVQSDALKEGKEMNIEKAVRKTSRMTGVFAEKEDIFRENLKASLSRYDNLGTLRALSGDKHIRLSKFKYIGKYGEEQRYQYGDVIIEVSDSPKTGAPIVKFFTKGNE